MPYINVDVDMCEFEDEDLIQVLVDRGYNVSKDYIEARKVSESPFQLAESIRLSYYLKSKPIPVELVKLLESILGVHVQ